MHEILSSLPWYWKVGFTVLMLLMTWPVLRAFVRSKRELPRKPSTPMPPCPPAPARKRPVEHRLTVRPFEVDEDFWLPRYDPLATDEDGHDHFVPDWKCEYCGTMNTSRRACHYCGAPRSESVRVEKVAKKVGNPIPPPE